MAKERYEDSHFGRKEKIRLTLLPADRGVQKTFLSKEIVKRIEGITEFIRSTLHESCPEFLLSKHLN